MPDTTYAPKIYRKQGGNEMVVASGGAINVEPGGAINVNGQPVTQYMLPMDIADGSADAVYYLVCPHAGVIAKIWSVIDGAVLTADITITAAIGATPVTNGVVTITQAGSAAGDVDVATPTAARAVTAGQAIKLTVAGGGAAGAPRIHVVVVIER
jgi:hypothetical protein